MTYIGTTDYALEAAAGNVTDTATVNKFGKALDCDAGAATDLWDGADTVPTGTKVWVPPSGAKIHDLKSTSANDTLAGSGMQKCQIWYLPDWDTAEVTAVLDMNGTTNVATPSNVIIHRMKGVQFGSGATNAGIVTATSRTPATVTAAIQTGKGQSQMAIYGVPSTQTFFMEILKCRIVQAASILRTQIAVLVDERADQSDSGYLNKGDYAFTSNSQLINPYHPPKVFAGPCIIKVQAAAASNNMQVIGEFDGYLRTN